MKKSLAILLALVIIVSGAFVGCQKKNPEEEIINSADGSVDGLDGADNEIDFIEQEVTDENGKAVTDANGEKVTEEVAVLVTEDSKGNTIGIMLDAEGNPKKDSKGNTQTTKYDKKKKKDKTTTTKKGGKDNTVSPTDATTTTTTTAAPVDGKETTQAQSSTKRYAPVPSTKDSGKSVEISSEDTTAITYMLEVPYLYETSYENAQGVPAAAASHAALWMLQREGTGMTTFPSGTVVIDLFKYFGQTVVGYKGNCNKTSVEAIRYTADNDTFSVSGYEKQTHTVEITKVEDLGNNFFKVTGKVKGASGVSKVVAIMQKNKLDLSLGFSVKALKWS